MIVWSTAAAVAASTTGYLLPWDQLALREITAGSDVGGMAALWQYDVIFVLIDGAEVGGETVRRWAMGHVAIPAVGVLMPALAWARRRRRHPTVVAVDDGLWRPPAEG